MPPLGPSTVDSAESIARLQRLRDRLGRWNRVDELGRDLDDLSKGWLKSVRTDLKLREQRGDRTISTKVADRLKRMEQRLDEIDADRGEPGVCEHPGCDARLSFASRAAGNTKCAPHRPSAALRLLVLA